MDLATAKAIATWFDNMVSEQPSLPVGTHHVDETVTIHVKGDVVKHQDKEDYPGTIFIPVKALAATLLPRLGATRESAIEVLVESLEEAFALNKSADETMKSRMKDADSAYELFQKRVISKLPLKTRSGKTSVRVDVKEVVSGNENEIGFTKEVSENLAPNLPNVVTE